jgi:hypothetical protein
MPDQRKYGVQDQQLTFCLASRELVKPLDDCAHLSHSGRGRRERGDRMSSPGNEVGSPRNSSPSAAVAA